MTAQAVSNSTPIQLGLVTGLVALAFGVGGFWQRVTVLEHDSIITQQMLKETRELSSDNKRRLDFIEREARDR